MGSEYDYAGLGSLFGATSSSQDLAGLFGTDSNPPATNPYGTGGNLQLAPLYSNPGHQHGDTLNRRHAGFQPRDNYYEDDYEEDLQSHMNFDANGMRVGVSMSRSHQTPFGTARTNVGMEMSIGPGGMMIRSRSSSSLHGGGHGGILMMTSLGGGSRHSGLGHSMFEPVGSMLSPLGGLFSPLGGMFSPMFGSYCPEHEPSHFGFRRPQRTTSRNEGSARSSDGPIIEEVFDDEESEHSSSRFAIEYKEEDIDSLGLGLLPDAETTKSGDNQNGKIQNKFESESFPEESGILNEFAYMDTTPIAHCMCPDNEAEYTSGKLTDKNQTQTQKVTNHSLPGQTETKENRSNESIDKNASDYSNSDEILDMNKCEQSNTRNDNVQSKPKERAKFTKQTFKNTPFKDHGALSFLSPPSNESLSLNTGQSGSTVVRKEKVNKNKQMGKSKSGTVNKNSALRRRSDSTCSSSSEQGWTTGHNFPEPSVEIECTPISQLVSEKQNDGINKALIEKEKVYTKPEGIKGENHTVPVTKAHLPEDNSERFESLQNTEENSDLAEGDTSRNDDIRLDGRPESLQESRDFKPVAGNAEKIFSELFDRTSEVDIRCRNDESDLFHNPITDNTSTADRDSPTDLTQEGFVSNPDNKSSSVEQTAPYRHSPIHSMIVDSQDNIECQTYDEQNRATEGSLDNESNAKMFGRSSSPQDFATHDPHTQMAPYEDIKDERRSESRLHFEQSDDAAVFKVGLRIQGVNASTDTNNSTSTESNRETQKTLTKTISSTGQKKIRTCMVIYLGDDSDDNADKKITTFMPKEERKNEAGSMFQVKHTHENPGSAQSGHEEQTETTDDSSSEQNFQKTTNYQQNFPVQKNNDQRPNGGNQNLENPSGKLKESVTNIETLKAPIYSQEEARTSPVLENFKIDTVEVSKPHENSRHDFHPTRDAHVKSSPLSASNQQHNILRKTRNGHQNTDDGRTSLDDEFYSRKKQSQLPHSNHVPHNQDTDYSSHNNYGQGIAHTKRRHSHHVCACHCPHRNINLMNSACNHIYICHDCGKHFTTEEYSKIKTDQDEDDIYEHPDWKYLNEYKDTAGQVTEPKQRRDKAKVNKNITANIESTPAFSKQVSRGSGTYNNFGDLVESVGLTMKDVYPDGNCLFTAICDQLRIRGDFSYTPRDLRHAAVDYLKEHPNQDDGTPLLAFLADEERNWDKYLSSMRREGHWGDHFVIWALAHVLHRRFIIYRGETELHKTVVEPSGPMTEDAFEEETDNNVATGDRKDNEGKDTDAERQRDEISTPIQKEEMYLGHISESHYVSLRPHGWRDNLFDALKNKQTSSLIGCNPESSSLNCETKMKQDAPQTHLTFAMKYIRMSDTVFCVSNKEDLSEISRSKPTIEFYAERLDVMNGLIAGSKKAKEDGDTIMKALLIPLDTRIYNATSNSKLSIKDLISDKSNCSSDCTKLVAIEPACWMNNLDKDNCLKQIHASLTLSHATNRKSYLAFECEWPDENAEWLTRNRMHNWPEPEIVNYIKRNGCRVVPKCDPICDCPLAEWQFIFDKAEQVISQHAVTEEQLDCFLVVKIALENSFDEPLTLTQLKHVFFYMCEETDQTLWKTELAECVWIFLGRLKECVRSKYIPNYFMPHVNLLEGHVNEEYILHCTKCIDILQRHPLVLLYFMCDDYPHILLEVNSLFDRLVEDCRNYSLHQNVSKSIRLCFLPIIAENISGLVRLNKYMKALEKCQVTTEKLNLHVPDGKKLHLEDVISKVILLSCDSLNQWLFAFVADQKLGTFCTETVCEGQTTVSIFSYYGPELANNLRLQADDILIPLELVSLRYLAETTSYMLDILEEMCPPAVCREVVIFFLSKHMNQLVRSIRSNTTSATQSKYLTKVMNKMQLKISSDAKL